MGTVRGLRRTQEDGHICETSKKGTLICVFDGHGGAHVARYLQENFSNPSFLARSSFFENPLDEMSKRLVEIDKLLGSDSSVLRKYIDPSIPMDESVNIADNVGSTALCVLITPKKLDVVSLGDSEVCVIDKKGGTSFRNKIHDVNNKSEKKRLQERKENGADFQIDDGYIVVGENAINMTRSIGDHVFKKAQDKQGLGVLDNTPWQKSYEFSPDDKYVVIGCDGVWDFITPSEIFQHVEKHKALITSINNIIGDIIKKKGGSDNITIAIYVL